MEKKKDDIFKNLIQKAGTENPSADFTNSVMKMIKRDAVQELVKEDSLRSLLQGNVFIEKPSSSFNRNVMRKVMPVKTKVEPIISRSAWFLIAASVVITILCYSMAVEPTDGIQTSSRAGLTMSGVIIKIESLPLIYPATIFGLAVLMLADYYVRERLGNRMIRI